MRLVMSVRPSFYLSAFSTNESVLVTQIFVKFLLRIFPTKKSLEKKKSLVKFNKSNTTLYRS